MEDVLVEQGRLLVAGLDQATAHACIKTMLTLATNIHNHPAESKYRTINLSNAGFHDRVWIHPIAQTLLALCGWNEVGGSLQLPEGDMDGLIPVLQALYGQTAPAAPTPAAAPLRPATTTGAPTTTAAPNPNPNPTADSRKAAAITEEREKAQQQMAREKAERARIKQQIDEDRRNVAVRPTLQASHAGGPAPGSRMTTFRDVGVDLNASGG